MSISPFGSEKELVAFARLFLRARLTTFRKDIAICLTANNRGEHAYFPALITCISFVDFLSGLYAGKLDGHGLKELQRYARTFMVAKNYDADRMGILYECFRHKVAHLGHPYAVFDTSTKRTLASQKQRRIAWTVYASNRAVPIELTDYPQPRSLVKTKTPWTVYYDCRIKISIRRFSVDICKSIYGPGGYLKLLESDPLARQHFAKCMVDYFPP